MRKILWPIIIPLLTPRMLDLDIKKKEESLNIFKINKMFSNR